MPIDVQVNGERRRCEMREGWARLPLPRGAEVLVDPDWWVLRDEASAVDHFGTLGLRAVPLDVAMGGRRT